MVEIELEKQKFKTLLENTQVLAQRMTPGGTDITITPIIPREPGAEQNGVRILWRGFWCDVIAQSHAYSIQRSDGFQFRSPWYAGAEPLDHVKKALEGLFAQKNS